MRAPYAVTVCVLALLFVRDGEAQQAKTPEQIYAAAADSVFVVELHNADGEPVGVGTAFLVGDRRLITNAHVVEGGKPYLRVGPVLVGCTIEKRDSVNDLVVLTVETPISAPPLTLDPANQKPGSHVYAVGTAEGLEKTISDGLLTGIRTTPQRKLIQISAPISPGSSGGPIFNSNGAVIGIAVGFLSEGQNINFAVPASAAIALLKSTAFAATERNFEAIIATAEHASADLRNNGILTTKSTDADLEKEDALSKRAEALWNDALAAAGSNVELLKRVCLSASEAGESEASLRAGLKLLELKVSIDKNVRSTIVEAIYWQSVFPHDPDTALVEKALDLAKPLVSTPDKADAKDLKAVGDLNLRLKRYREADKFYQYALRRADATGLQDVLSEQILSSLIDVNFAIKNVAAAKKYYGIMKQQFDISVFDIERYAEGLSEDRLSATDAAEAYVTAANARWKNIMTAYADPNAAQDLRVERSSAAKDFCEASRLFYQTQDYDRQLSNGKQCFDVSNDISDSVDKTALEDTLALTHRLTAVTLNKRGVYEEALAHGLEAVALDAEDGFAYYEIAFALKKLGRAREAVEPAKAALKFSDGKWSEFHFLLGGIYFELGNWQLAEVSYEKASELDKDDTAAPYNVALCLIRQGYGRDAAKWFREVLRRDPNYRDKSDLLKRIRQLEN